MLQVKVNLREYPVMWERLQIASLRATAGTTAEQLISEVFGFDVIINHCDTAGNVIMDEAARTWLDLKWN